MNSHRLRISTPVVVLVLALGITACGSDESQKKSAKPKASPPVSLEQLGIDSTDIGRCDPIVPTRCLLPYPNDYYMVSDASTPTGMRLNLTADSLPANNNGVHIDPTAWNVHDGFSVGSALLVNLGTVDVTKDTVPQIDSIEHSLEPDSAVTVVDLDTNEVHPVFIEMNANEPADAKQTMIIRAAVNWTDGHHYAVGIHGLTNAKGKPIEASPAFRAYRDNRISTDENFEARRPSMERIFEALGTAGVGRDALQLAWSFTVGSTEGITGTAVALRDDAFATLGDAAPKIGMSYFGGYSFDPYAELQATHDLVQIFAGPDVPPFKNIWRYIDGVIYGPSYLAGIGPERTIQFDANGKPIVQDPNTPFRFRCMIPESAATTPARVAIYGHGLMGTIDELGSDMVIDMANRYNTIYCGINFLGMSSHEITTAMAALGDLSKFSNLVAQSQQGILNTQLLARAISHPDGLRKQGVMIVRDPRMLLGTPPYDREAELAKPSFMSDAPPVYDGNSQGSISGGPVMALSPDIDRGVLAEAGMNYSFLLNRSVDFDDYKLVFDPAYPDPYDQFIGLNLIQTLWDSTELNGYAQHITRDPLPGSKAKEVLLLGAVGDHQVSEFALQVEARTMQVPARLPLTAKDRTKGSLHSFGFSKLKFPAKGSGYFLFDTGSPSSPLENVAPREGHDPHDDTPNIPSVQDLKNAFYNGEMSDVCEAVCTGPPRE